MNVNETSALGALQNRGGSSDEKDRTELGQQDFLELMTTQLQNQDPMKPMENGQFMAQMAQFSSAQGIQELQSSFAEFQKSMTGNQALEASGLVGRTVTVQSNQGQLPEDGNLTGAVQLGRSVRNLTVAVSDGAGSRVAEIALGQQQAGSVDFAWDGRNAEGDRLPAGNYQVVAETETANGTETFPVEVGGEVTSVALAGDGRAPKLTVAGAGEVGLNDVQRVQ